MPQRPSNIWALVKLVMFLPFQLSEVSVLIKYLYVDGYFPLDLLCMWIYWPQILSIPKVTVVCRRSFRNQRRRGTFGRVDAGSPCISQPLPPWWPQSVCHGIHSLPTLTPSQRSCLTQKALVCRDTRCWVCKLEESVTLKTL